MNKTELIAAMAETSGLSKKDCETALAAFITTTENTLKAGNKVQLVGFGSFGCGSLCIPVPMPDWLVIPVRSLFPPAWEIALGFAGYLPVFLYHRYK